MIKLPQSTFKYNLEKRSEKITATLKASNFICHFCCLLLNHLHLKETVEQAHGVYIEPHCHGSLGAICG